MGENDKGGGDSVIDKAENKKLEAEDNKVKQPTDDKVAAGKGTQRQTGTDGGHVLHGMFDDDRGKESSKVDDKQSRDVSEKEKPKEQEAGNDKEKESKDKEEQEREAMKNKEEAKDVIPNKGTSSGTDVKDSKV